MKIAYVLDDRLDKPDGVQQYILLVGEWMRSQGHEVHYLVGNSPQATVANVHGLSRTFGVSFNKNRVRIPLPASSKVIKQLLQTEQFDVLHVQMPYSPLLASKVIMAAAPDTAIVGTFHILPHGKASAAGTKLLGKLLVRSKKRFQGFISVSSAAQTFAKSHFGIESIVLPNVVDLALFKSGTPLEIYSDKLNIVFLGRFVERKGAQYLIAACIALLHKFPEYASKIRIILCGDGPLKAQLQKECVVLEQQGCEVIFTGFLPEKDKKHYLASASIAAFPATGGESFGIVLIEAMAAGAGVVLGGNNDGYKTVLGGQPLTIIDPLQTDVFAQKLHELLQNKQLRRQIHEQQQQLVHTFDIETVGPKLVAFYQQALAVKGK